MSFIPANAGAAAAAGAAARRRRQTREEEDMTGYLPEHLEGWEFKILRSHRGKFRDPEFQRRMLEEEARVGWELLEKFDDGRLRLKRPVAERSRDRLSDQDPCRVSVGMSPNSVTVWILAFGLVALVGLAAIAIALKV